LGKTGARRGQGRPWIPHRFNEDQIVDRPKNDLAELEALGELTTSPDYAEPLGRPSENRQRRPADHERIGHDRPEIDPLGGFKNPVRDLDRPGLSSLRN
jgi:hypothetical protein